ncbi:MAG TPA: DUF2789 domain-containing protein [Rhodocyclaceae bacterium]|jgi:hypothetical protein|nr:DUF2789 domain-containing protein [Rhodocyclaceae bacterium]
MEYPQHSMNQLFAQLGLPADDTSIDMFIATHGPLANEVALSDGPFWSPAQAAFLQVEILEDADWAEVVDALNVRFRAVRKG